MKTKRHETIIKLVESGQLSSQEDLVRLLNEQGFVVTQATVSRDLKDLGIVKTREDGKTKYIIGTESMSKQEDEPEQSASEADCFNTDEETAIKEIPGVSLNGIQFVPGSEPINIRKRLDRLFEKLNEVYPDKIVVGLYKDHSSMGDTVTELYRHLGYPDGNSFLNAYGYQTASAALGRKSTIDPAAIIAQLKEKYPKGTTMTKAELQNANPDIPWKSLQNRSFEFFGMTLSKYLAIEGILTAGWGISQDPKPENTSVIKIDKAQTASKQIRLNERKKAILKLIAEETIGSQEELVGRLSDLGFKATQATVSRDIKDLELIKTRTETGFCYTSHLDYSKIIEDTTRVADQMNQPAAMTSNKTNKKSGQQNKADKETINIYQFSDEAIKAQLEIIGDLHDLLNNKLNRSQMRLSVDTPNGTIEIINQACTDMKRLLEHTRSESYDMYVAERYYLDRHEMQRRRRIVDKGVSDWFYDARPEIDWAAQELTNEQILTRYLFLATIAIKVMTSNLAQELIAFMPKTDEGMLMRNPVTRIATGNIVTKDAKILELIAEAQTQTNIIIHAQLRKFTKEEVGIVEKDFLSTHLPDFDLDTITEVPKQESKEETPYWFEKTTIYKPDSFQWEDAPRWEDPSDQLVSSKRYDGIVLWFNSVWEVSKKGYEYTNNEDRVERFDISRAGHLWAPLVDNHDFPLEKPLYTDKVRLETVILSRAQMERKRFSRDVNRFFYLMDKACIKDAIEKKDLTLLQERGRFLSAENIEECILFAKEQYANECLAWLESQFDAIMTVNNAVVEEPYGYLENLQDNKSLIARAEEWMNTYDDILEKDPDIQIEGKTFVTSGVYSLSKDYWDQGLFDLDKIIEEKGGKVRQKISGVTDYLIVDPSEAGESKSKTVREKKSQGKPIKLVLIQDMERALGLKSDEELAREKTFLYGLISDEKKAELKKMAEESDEDFDDFFDSVFSNNQDEAEELNLDDFNLDD